MTLWWPLQGQTLLDLMGHVKDKDMDFNILPYTWICTYPCIWIHIAMGMYVHMYIIVTLDDNAHPELGVPS